ncbi:Flagellar hook-associated protein flgK [Georgfuchsia toluolica]|uniref:Flagellar hook-associated protein 1 n=1 Tax=Georgfuchsia toluolica TaxID=424218 RepID=A0A916J485_9PROT|nr:flagellar hook-associated protein FlgK [Georgfuchsia toluolica]CAG4882182.1 Flagellar hook-associated protein flgK [Georgfuchsia toluolica]
MAIGILNAGLSGLNAAQMGLATTGHNISNVSTPGFNRQQVVQTTQIAVATGAGFVGQGTQVSTVRRLYSDFLDHQVLASQADSSRLSTYYSQIQQIDNMLGDSSSGLAPVLQGFFSALQTAANNPADSTSRQVVLNAGDSLAAGFNSLDQSLARMGDAINSQLKASIASINSYVQQIAQLNQKIVVAQSGANRQPANDLLDQRDALIADLNKEVKVTVLAQDDGASSIFVGNGQGLVLGSTSFALNTVNSPTDSGRIQIGYSSPGGAIPLPESGFQGGNLGGLLAFRSETLDSTRNMLGRVALTLADTFNQQHQLGQDINGALGGKFFNIGGPQIAASLKNTGSAVIAGALSNSAALTTSDYKLGFDGTVYTLTRLSDGNQQTFATLPQTVDGVALALTSGAAAAGDEFLIRPTVAGAGSISVAITDAAKLALAAPIRTTSGAANIGSGQISAGVVNGPPPANTNLRQSVTLTFTSAGTFDVSGTGTGIPAASMAYVPGKDISYNGWTVQISGTPVTGDVFSIVQNTVGVADNRNVLLLAGLQTANSVGGTMSYQSAYGNLVGNIGNKTHELDITSTAQAALVAQTTAARESFSGVNLDEEAAQLMRYQQAYQASAKVMAMANKLFDSILQLG